MGQALVFGLAASRCIAAVVLALAVVVGRVALEGVDGKTMAVAT